MPSGPSDDKSGDKPADEQDTDVTPGPTPPPVLTPTDLPGFVPDVREPPGEEFEGESSLISEVPESDSDHEKLDSRLVDPQFDAPSSEPERLVADRDEGASEMEWDDPSTETVKTDDIAAVLKSEAKASQEPGFSPAIAIALLAGGLLVSAAVLFYLR